jgi:hypothetical protein
MFQCKHGLSIFEIDSSYIHSEITVIPVYKRLWRELQNVPFMNSCHSYTDSKHMQYSINGENETALYRQWFAIYWFPQRQVWLLWSEVNASLA